MKTPAPCLSLSAFSLRPCVRIVAFLAACAAVSATTIEWTQTGSSGNGSWNVPFEPVTNNMNWLLGANWNTGNAPDASGQIVFGDVTSDLNTNAGLGINGRFVALVDADFLGDSTSSLTIAQATAGRQNVVGIRHSSDAASPASLTFQVGQVSVSTGGELRYTGGSTTGTDAVRMFTLGYGGTSVTNDGTLTFSFSGASNNRAIKAGLQIAVGSLFTNTGVFTLNASAPNNQVQGGTRLNALIGDTVNSGSIVINRSGDSTSAGTVNVSFDAAQGGIEFASLSNSGAGSSFVMTVNNASTLVPNTALPVDDRAANLVIAGQLKNEGSFTLARTPLASSADNASRTVTARAGSLSNEASGAFVLSHANASTALTTTSSLVDFTVTGSAANKGYVSLSGTSATVAAGNIVTRLVTQSGFSNAAGGILSVSGAALLQNTGDLSNSNTLSTRLIQGSERVWDTRGLVIATTSAGAGSSLLWATGVTVDAASLSDATFTAANFTIGSLSLSGNYALSGGGDLLIAGNFQLGGTLYLGDWSGVTSQGGKGQTLVFSNTDLTSAVGALIASGDISATLADGWSLSVFTSASNDAFYIGVTNSAIPEPSSAAALLAFVAGAVTLLSRRRHGFATT